MVSTQSQDAALAARGLQRLTDIRLGLETTIYWHPEKRIEICVSDVGDRLLVKGMKKYVIVSQAADGRETYERDLTDLMRYMRDHFPEAHLYLGFFRDIPVQLVPGFEVAAQAPQALEERQHRLLEVQEQKGKKQRLVSLFRELNEFGEARAVLGERVRALDGEESVLRAELQRLQAQLADHHELVRAYQEVGRATLLAFGYSSPLFLAPLDGLGTAVDAVIDDVMNTHHTSIHQKLEGGQLQLFIEELRFPSIFYVAESVGAFAPGQLERVVGDLPEPIAHRLRDATVSMLQVSPAEDIDVPGHRVAAKRLAAHALRDFLNCIEKVDSVSPPPNVPTRGILIGQILQGARLTKTPFLLPLDDLTHVYCSGTSGSGKSFLSRVIAEGAIAERRNVVVLDPGNQWASLPLPEDRKEILARYRSFGLSASMARGFPADVLRPQEMSAEIHTRLERLDGRPVIFSLKGFPKDAACRLAAEILERLFRIHSHEETGSLRTLVVIEEAHRFTKRRSDEAEAKDAVARVEDAIDLIGREGRKYGLNVLLVSQTIRDFARSAATIRQNTNTKIFMHNSDLELDYASGYLTDAQQLTQLRPGEALIHNPQFGTFKVAVRPPFSKVIELPPEESHCPMPSHEYASPSPLGGSKEEQELLDVIREHFESAGEPINVSQAMEAVGVTSGRRKQQLVDALEQRGLIRSERLRQRGGPRVLYPTGS